MRLGTVLESVNPLKENWITQITLDIVKNSVKTLPTKKTSSSVGEKNQISLENSTRHLRKQRHQPYTGTNQEEAWASFQEDKTEVFSSITVKGELR